MRPLLLGHRGARASKHIPENTLASFELCLQHGCDGFEFDVRLAADGIAVVCHDPMFAGQEIATTSAKSLRLPTLDEVLRQFSERAFLDIELKVTDGGSHVVAALRAHPPQKGYVVSSFLPHALCAVHNFNESIPLGFLREGKYEPCPAEPHDKPTLPAAWVIPHRSLVDQESIRQAHSAGSKVMVWTVDRGDEMQQLSDWGADAIISDDTALLAATFQ